MRFHADLHVHSKYSRATSRQADLEHLAYWAAIKGLTVVGTGDFTHPGWMQEIRQKLIPAEPGLYRLRLDIETEIMSRLPMACRRPVRFMLEVEISTIYKKNGKTRKIHHLIYVPDLQTADRLIAGLSAVSNLAADGRPILKLDSRDLLAMTLDSGPLAYLVPAHIWTPWFAALGSRSGFDSIDECYGDLAGEVFALETGLSSDPPMNWRLSGLDRYQLVSSSDAHSPSKLGREATMFDTELDYAAIRRAMETGSGLAGTIEFFPDEGKYHLDGHRKCGVCLTPDETLRLSHRCPVCGAPVTIGVLHRISALADRTESAALTNAGRRCEVRSLVPLHEILAEIIGSGAASKRVETCYRSLVDKLGPELDILATVPLDAIRRAQGTLIAEAIARLRARRVIRQGGYDGAYGVIRLFDEDELRKKKARGLMFEPPAQTKAGQQMDTAGKERPARAVAAPYRDLDKDRAVWPVRQPSLFPIHGILGDLDPDQRKAAAITKGPVLITAGPGSGKTRTLTHRIAHLVAEGVPAASCLAITFTRRATLEMRERLEKLLPRQAEKIPIHTFHSLGQHILQEQAGAAGLPPHFRVADDLERTELIKALLDVRTHKAKSLLAAISRAKRTGQSGGDEVTAALEVYQPELGRRGWVDFDDLVGLPLRLLASRPALAATYRGRYGWISVDEFQDVDEQQYRLVRLLAQADAHLCAIGDPNQAIYGFKGADSASLSRFRQDYPHAALIQLKRNYRSAGTIVRASSQVIGAGRDSMTPQAEIVRDMRERITIHKASSDRAEAEYIAHRIEQIIGGQRVLPVDFGRANDDRQTRLSYADFAILYRTDAQADALIDALDRSGIPYKKHNHLLLIEEPLVQAILHRVNPKAKTTASVELKAAAATVMRAADTADIGALETTLQQLLALARSCQDRLDWFLDAVPLATEADCFDPQADRISLLTLHASKGLEFKVVFIAGCEEGILPLHWSRSAGADLEEERRLAYVGMTRAMDRLFLTHAEQRSWRGAIHSLPPSPFLQDIGAELILTSHSAVRRARTGSQLSLL